MDLESFLHVLKSRRSIRRYLEKPIEADLLRKIAETGLIAPYAGDPTVQVTVVTSATLLGEISVAAKHVATQSGIPHLVQLGHSADFNPLYGAPALLLLSDTADGLCPDVNCAAAAENILLTAQAAGLGGCWLYFALMAFQGEDSAELTKAIRLPAGHKLCALLVLGYPGDDTVPSPRPMNRITMV